MHVLVVFLFFVLNMLYDMDMCQFYLAIKIPNLFLWRWLYDHPYNMSTSSLLILLVTVYSFNLNLIYYSFYFVYTCKLIKTLNYHSYQRTCFSSANFNLNKMYTNLKHGVCFWLFLAIS